MISIEQINGEIAALEDERPTHVVMQKLASLYIVRDHMVIGGQSEAENKAVMSIITVENPFTYIIKGKDINGVYEAINELLEALQVINPRLYDGFIRKVQEL